MKDIHDMITLNRRRSIFAIICCTVMAASVFMGVIIRLLAKPDEFVVEIGMQALRMFTILSNILVALCATQCIPYAVDGLRKRNYHLPRWVVYTMYVGVSSVAVTFIIACAALSPVAGFQNIMLTGTNLLLHTICPVFAILLFLFVNTDHEIPFRVSIIGILPVLVYGIVYAIEVFFIGEANGGWPDHYRLNVYVPWPVAYIAFFGVSFGVANLLRIIHNAMHRKKKAALKSFYQTCDEFSYQRIELAIAALALEDRKRDKGEGDMDVPRRVFAMMEEKYKSGLSMEKMCELYVKSYLDPATVGGNEE